mgnify:CR=1 FL=1
MTDIPKSRPVSITEKSGKSRRRSARGDSDKVATRTGAGQPSPVTGLAKPPTKLDRILDLLSRKDGATLAELSVSTGWQPHSVRGALAGALKRKGHNVTSEKVDGERRYWITPAK